MRFKTKNRKLRWVIYYRSRQNIPRSSKLHYYLKCVKLRSKHFVSKFKGVGALAFYISQAQRLKCNEVSRYTSLLSYNRPMSLYKSESHAMTYCKSKLCNDIETNPGPHDMLPYIDPRKTITAPYSQGNAIIFGQNAGQQCVAMSLCSLIFNNIKGINSSNDLVKIMDIGNQLYTRLSQSARQSFLMQSELPSLLNVFDTDYELQYSESYTGNTHEDTSIEGYNNCTSLQTAFQCLMSNNYTSFILTIGCPAVGIYCHGDITFKVFDSHARDAYGRSNAHGTCVLIELSSLDNLILYFKSIHDNAIFEIKGVRVNEVTMPIENTPTDSKKFNLSCTVALYSICYSAMKSCSYWNSDTLNNIVKGGQRFCDHLSFNRYITTEDIPCTVDICGATVTCVTDTMINGALSDSVESKSSFESIINDNVSKSSGLLIWFQTHCICCILKTKRKSKFTYLFLLYDSSKTLPLQYEKTISGTCLLVDTIINVTKQSHSKHLEYKLQFLSCNCNVNNNERKRLMKNQRKRQNYEAMAPPKKKMP
jgi:hypothetical protein